MGKKNKGKKTGKGAEKTLVKTEKKISLKMKKELKALGEDTIENILEEIEKEEKKKLAVVETVVGQPSRRLNFSLVAHPDKEELILYGGEFFNGLKTIIYNDLFFYNIVTNSWTIVKSPGSPPPRCSHQMITTSANKGQLWIFGGEFCSSTQSQFYHYRDLWVYHLATKQWEKITAPNGPSARSGHRMVVVKKHLYVFGGFHDNLRECKYFNDIYSFNMETYQWIKLEPTGTAPSSRSGCCMVALNDGRILIYGGYSKEKIKKDVEKGHVHTDAFLLTPNKNDNTKFQWVQTKIGGIQFSSRCSMPIVSSPNGLAAYCYGGVFDTDDGEEDLTSNFFNDFFKLDLEKLVWRNIILSGKRNKDVKLDKQKNEDKKISDENSTEVEVIEQRIESTSLSNDGVFTMILGNAPPTSSKTSTNTNVKVPILFQPTPRLNPGLAIKHGILYLYGGMYEDGNKQITYNDLYSLDLKKMDEWKTIISDNESMEWLSSESEDSENEETDEDMEDELEEEESNTDND